MRVQRTPVITIGTPETLKFDYSLADQDAIAIARAFSCKEMIERFGQNHALIFSEGDRLLVLRALDCLVNEIANRITKGE